MPAGEATQDNVDKIRTAVADTGIDAASSPIVNTSGESIRVQTEVMNNDEADEVSNAIAEAVGVDAQDDISTQDIGASWGEQVAKRALTGLVVFLVLVVLFIWAYFREWKMSVAAIVALIHDIVITIGVYALSGFEVTPATVTGLLTILGFSLYDTVVVFDKVRENTKNLRQSHRTYAELANLAVNQTLVRSINTSIVALLPVGAILYVSVVTLGSGALKDLSLALFVGMAAGAYSSIFIATPLAVQLKSNEKEITQQDARAKARARRERRPLRRRPGVHRRHAGDATRTTTHDPASDARRRQPPRWGAEPTPEASGSGPGRPRHQEAARATAAPRVGPSRRRQPRSKRNK